MIPLFSAARLLNHFILSLAARLAEIETGKKIYLSNSVLGSIHLSILQIRRRGHGGNNLMKRGGERSKIAENLRS